MNDTPVTLVSNPLFTAIAAGATVRIFPRNYIARMYINSLSTRDIAKVIGPLRTHRRVQGIEITSLPIPDLQKYMDKMYKAALELAGAKITTFGNLKKGDLFDISRDPVFRGTLVKGGDTYAFVYPKRKRSQPIDMEPNCPVIYLPNAGVKIWPD